MALDIDSDGPHTSAMTSPDHYDPPSYRGAIIILVVSLIGIGVAWYLIANLLF